MKRTGRRLLTSLVIFVFVLFLFIFIQKLPAFFKKENKVFPSLKKDNIRHLVIVDDKDEVRMEKKDNRWWVGEFPADQERIDNIIDALSRLKKGEIISSSKERYSIFEVDGRKKITFNDFIVYVGKNYSFGKSYFRTEEDPLVYVTSEDFSTFFYPKDFRDLKINLIVDENKVALVEEVWEGKTIKLVKKENQWFFNNNKQAKKERVDFLINDIKTLKGDDIFNKKDIDLSKSDVDLTITVSEDKREKRGNFYKKDKEKLYFYQEESSYIYQIPIAYIASLKKEEKDLIE